MITFPVLGSRQRNSPKPNMSVICVLRSIRNVWLCLSRNIAFASRASDSFSLFADSTMMGMNGSLARISRSRRLHQSGEGSSFIIPSGNSASVITPSMFPW